MPNANRFIDWLLHFNQHHHRRNRAFFFFFQSNTNIKDLFYSRHSWSQRENSKTLAKNERSARKKKKKIPITGTGFICVSSTLLAFCVYTHRLGTVQIFNWTDRHNKYQLAILNDLCERFQDKSEKKFLR